MASDPHTLLLRRRYAGIAFGTGSLAILLAVLAQSTPSGSVLESIELAALYANRALIALLLWGIASASILIGCILTANTLRGPRTQMALLGCLGLALGSALFFTIRIATGGLRYLFGVAATSGVDAQQIDAMLSIASALLTLVVPLLVLGGTFLTIGFDQSGVSSWFTGATWSVSLICYGLVTGVWWAEAVTAAAVSLALLVMGVEIARFRPAFALSGAAQARTTWI